MAKKKKKHKKDPASWKIKRRRDGDTHIQACQEGYLPGSSKFKQVHHIVCVSSMADGTISEKAGEDNLDFVKTCLKATNWDINDSLNNVGLPLKRAFVDKRAPQNWDGWPCHLVEHPDYTEKVSTRLNSKVWTKCQKKAESCELEDRDLAEQLKGESKHWLDFLVGRGAGSKNAWVTRHKNKNTWYIPFSMNPGKPLKRNPPPDWDKFAESMKQYLKNMFSHF